MDIIGEVINEGPVNSLFVEGGLFAASRTNTGHRGAHTGAGTAEVVSIFIYLIEKLLGIFCGGPDEHDISGLTMKSDQSRAVFLPTVGEFSQ